MSLPLPLESDVRALLAAFARAWAARDLNQTMRCLTVDCT
jgi:hypothetical protein